MCLMTDADQLEVGRLSHELASRMGPLQAAEHAAKRAEEAATQGDKERAQLWQWVEAALKPR